MQTNISLLDCDKPIWFSTDHYANTEHYEPVDWYYQIALRKWVIENPPQKSLLETTMLVLLKLMIQAKYELHKYLKTDLLAHSPYISPENWQRYLSSLSLRLNKPVTYNQLFGPENHLKQTSTPEPVSNLQHRSHAPIDYLFPREHGTFMVHLDLSYTDEDLVRDYRYIIKMLRKIDQFESSDFIKPTLKRLKLLSHYRILAYHDFTIWSQLTGIKYSNRALSYLIYPNGEADIMRAKKLAKQTLTHKFIDALLNAKSFYIRKYN